METKREFRYFTIAEYEKEQQYLSKRHREGWKLVKVTGFGRYHFEQCKPEEVVYQLDFNREGTADQPGYAQLFEDCGWEYVTTYTGYSYFRKPVSAMKEEEEIFFDDNSKLEMMQRILKGRMIPMLVTFFLYLLWQLVIRRYFSGGFFEFVSAMLLTSVIIYFLVTIQYVVKYIGHVRRVKK